MSHFIVLVIGENVEEQLAPYHEFESTGIENEHVVEVDITAKLLTAYEGETVRRLRDPDGNLHEPNGVQFYRDPTPEETKKIGPLAGMGCSHGISFTSQDWGDGRGYRTKVHFVPEGWAEVEVPNKEAMTIPEYVKYCYESPALLPGQKRDKTHTYGFAEYDGKGNLLRLVKRTNPNAKWDGWQVGGRATGALKLKAKARGVVGRPGLMTERAPTGYADQALKGDIDWEQMRNDETVKARALWKTVREITGGNSWESWSDTLLRYPELGDARKEYWEQPAITLLRESGHSAFRFDVDDELALDEEIYVQRRRDSACSFYAFVRDGQWTERGKMGWFGMASDEMSKPQWNGLFNAMLDNLPDDVMVTVVDCHI